MLRAIVIDDEKASISQFNKIAKQNSKVDLLGAFTDPLEGLMSIGTNKPNVVFLDINMPEMSGIYLAEQIIKLYPKTYIVFITAYDEYALKAFELNAMDYLLKPLTQERFCQCIDKIYQYDGKGTNVDNIHNLNYQFKESLKKLFIDNKDETILVKLDDIYYFEVMDKTVIIRTMPKTYTSSNSLKYFETKLQNSNFYRCHRSYLVNLDKVSRFICFSRNCYDVGFDDIKDTIPVSKSNIGVIQKILEY